MNLTDEERVKWVREALNSFGKGELTEASCLMAIDTIVAPFRQPTEADFEFARRLEKDPEVAALLKRIHGQG